jgi:hypothetical protein
MEKQFIRYNFDASKTGDLKGIIFSILIIAFLSTIGKAQKTDSARIWVGTMEEGDIIKGPELPEVWVFPGRYARSKKQEANFWKYVYKVKKVYPYALKAQELLKKYEPEYLACKTQRQKRKLINKVEDELMAQYKEQMKKMSIQEGRILIKLIDRETGRTSYSLIKDFRGNFAAFFWQSLAKLFGNDLKSRFDAAGEDRLIDEIVLMIENGQL